jgi:hypothetical protein
MASRCVIEVGEVLANYAKENPVVGKLVADYSKTLRGIQDIKVPKNEREVLTRGASIGLREAAARFTREGELEETFVRPGDVTIKAAKGKINKREAQQSKIMNQWGLAPAYSDIAGLQRRYTTSTSIPW